jgi:hypothetical protein
LWEHAQSNGRGAAIAAALLGPQAANLGRASVEELFHAKERR